MSIATNVRKRKLREEAAIIRSIVDEIRSMPQEYEARLKELEDMADRFETNKLGFVFSTKPKPIEVKSAIRKHAERVVAALNEYNHVAYYRVPIYGLIAVPGNVLDDKPKYRHEGPFLTLQYSDDKMIVHDGGKKKVLCEGGDDSVAMLVKKIIPNLRKCGIQKVVHP